MRGESRTTRQRIAEYLRNNTARASSLATEFGVSPDDVLSHVEHIAASLDESDEVLLVAPPECRDCGFDAFDDIANRPSRCPDCRSENVEEPTFRID